MNDSNERSNKRKIRTLSSCLLVRFEAHDLQFVGTAVFEGRREKERQRKEKNIRRTEYHSGVIYTPCEFSLGKRFADRRTYPFLATASKNASFTNFVTNFVW